MIKLASKKRRPAGRALRPPGARRRRIVFSLMIDGSDVYMEIRQEPRLDSECSGSDTPWRRTDAKKGNHRPRRMGHHGSLGNGTSRARAASTEAPTAHPNGRYQNAFNCPVASLGPSTCISPRQSAGCFPILIDRPFIENTASRTDKPEKDPPPAI